jgi:hypothetical protein
MTMLGPIVLGVLAIAGIVEVLFGWNIYGDATAIFQQVAGILLIGLGLILVAVCVGFSNILGLVANPKHAPESGLPHSRSGGVGPGLR